jgi:uncharacterized protein (DUF4213/DUF364 family)
MGCYESDHPRAPVNVHACEAQGQMSTVLARAREAFSSLIEQKRLSAHPVQVTTRALSTEEAIGRPKYDDLPLLRGKEVMIEAEFRGAKGHAFTAAPAPWEGALEELLQLPLGDNHHRAILTAAMNAVLRSLGEIDRTIHCRNEDIERCGEEMARKLRQEYGPISVGVIGYQPGLVVGLAQHFSPGNVHVTDMLQENIGRCVHGIEIWDGMTRTDDLAKTSQLILATGSTAANGTLDGILGLAEESRIPLVLYGVTGAAVCHLCGLRRACLLAA